MTKLVNQTLSKVDAFPAESIHTLDSALDPSTAVNQTWEYKKISNKSPLLVDGHLRVQLQNQDGQTAVLKDVFALGDNAMPENGAPPATAQATFQEAKWLATHLNKRDLEETPAFSFRNLGTMAYIGSEKALMQIPHDPHASRNKYLPHGLTGRMASLIWRMAYISMSISWRNKLRVAFRWTVNRLFGKDVSRF
jgi:NADH dehydrogenase, FAD-containing subunit